MKKTLSFVLSILLVVGLLSASAGSALADSAPEAKRLHIVTTIFPVYDWVMNVLGDQADSAEVTMLLNSGVDLHSYQPTVEDIVKIAGCDLFIYVGGESDEWVDDALAEAINKDMVVIDLLDILGDKVKEEEIVEGMEAEHDHDHEDDHEDEHDHDHEEAEYDEHVWLSLKHAKTISAAIADMLAKLDPANADSYRANAAVYAQKLDALDAQYKAAVDAAPVKTLLFGDRFPFRYLTDDYGLDYYAAFVGCSAETEASFQTIIFLANKLDELGLPAVLQIESADGSIVRTIVENTKSRSQQILTLDSMQSVTAKDVAAGTSYLAVMEKNLDVLKAALG